MPMLKPHGSSASTEAGPDLGMKLAPPLDDALPGRMLVCHGAYGEVWPQFGKAWDRLQRALAIR
jgi:hypothetical protein